MQLFRLADHGTTVATPRSHDGVRSFSCSRPFWPAMYVEDPRPLRRTELGLAVDPRIFSGAARDIMGWLSGQTNYPWTHFTWFGPFHTMSCDAMPPGPSGRRFDSMLFVPEPLGAPTVSFESFRGDPVRLLWFVPITTEEQSYAEEKGGEALAERLRRNGHGFIHKDRAPVA